MLVTERDRLKEDIVAWTKRFGTERSALIPILQEIQARYHRVSDFAMQVVADLLGIHPVEVYSVVSFYAFLDDKPKGKHVIRLCRTISCDMQGKENVANQLRADLDVDFGETTEDGMFTLEWTNCLGMCDQGPALMVNDEIHTRLTPEKVHDIVEECRGRFGLYALEHEEGHA